jgi:ABC-type branched-subunit amino acid transport system substrate-binding protein
VHYEIRRKGTALLLGVGALALAASACSSSSKSSTGSSNTTTASSSSANAGQPYTISFVGDLTGGNAQNAQPELAGAEGAVYAINQAGGVNGHPLKFTTVQDSQSTATGAETAVRTALGTPTTFTTGAMSGSEVAATASVYNSAGIPSIGVSYPVAALINSPNWFTLAPTGPQVAAGAVNGIKGLLGGSLQGKTIGFEGLQTPTVDNNLAAIKALVTADGGKMGPILRDPLTFTSWTSQAAQVASAHVDGFIINHAESSTAIVAKALLTAGLTVPIVATEGASSDTLFKTVGASNFYAVREASESAVAAGTPPAQAAAAAGYGSASTLNPYFAREWGVIYAVANALKSCGFPCSASSLESALTSMGSFTVPDNVYLGPVDFTSSQHAGLTTAQLYSYDSGKGMGVPSGQPFSINS